MFFHYLGLQDDSQSLCTVAVQKKEKNFVTDFFPPLFCTAASQRLLFISICAPFTEQHPCYQESVRGRWHRRELFLLCFFVFCQQHSVNTISDMFGDPSGCERWNCCLQEVLISKDLFLSFDSSTGKDAATFYTDRSKVTTRPTPALWCIIKNVGTRQQIFRYELISITQIQRTSTNTLVARDTRAGVDTSVSVPCQTVGVIQLMQSGSVTASSTASNQVTIEALRSQ